MTNQTPPSHTHEPTPEERLANAIEGIRHLPPVGGVTFRGITTPRTTAPSVLVTQNITATSRDLTVATIGLTSPGIAAVILHTGRDVTPLSAVPQAQEVALLPGTVLFTGRFVEIAGHTVEIVEQLLPTDDGKWTSSTTTEGLTRLTQAVATAINNATGQPCPINTAYCERFTTPIT